MTNGSDGFDAYSGVGTISGAGTYTSLPSNIRDKSDVTYVVTTTGGLLTGTLTVEISNSTPDQARLGEDKWDTYTVFNSGKPVAVAGAMTFNFELKRLGYGRVRLSFVRTAGTGTIAADVVVKG